MSLLSPQIIAFIAVIEETSFERAAQRLSVTPSAISQRIKQLEDRLGQLLIVRQFPCTPTPAGTQLLSRVKPMSLLESEVMADFLPDEPTATHANTFSIAVNEDSLATWLFNALAPLYHTHGYQFDIRIDNEDFTLEHLRNGQVIGALTSQPKALQGCQAHKLGNMRYCAVATPEIYQRYFRCGLSADAFQRAPMINYDHKDLLQHRFMKLVTGVEVHPKQIHYLPSATGIVDAAKLGMGWCVTLDGLLGDALDTQQLVNLTPDVSLYAPLYWQHAGVRSRVLTHITQAIAQQASQCLYP